MHRNSPHGQRPPFSLSPLQPIAIVVALAVGLPLGVNTAYAQTPPATVQRFDLPAGALDTTLTAIARQAGRIIVIEPALVNGLKAAPVQGELTMEQAFARALSGSGLELTEQNGGTLGVKRAETATLKAVKVQAAGFDGATEGTGSYSTQSSNTATGLPLSLRETPQSVSVITRQRMDDQALNSFDKVLEQVPGLYFWSSASGVGSGGEVRARGYPINSLQVDGVTVPSSLWGDYNTAAVDTAIYDSITVVRGATGLLTGAGDPSGSISLTRKRPTDTFQASVAQSIGRWDQLRSVGDVSGPLSAQGSLRGRLIAVHDEGESWVDRYEGEKDAAYGVLEVDLGDRTTLSLALEYAKQDATSAGVWTSGSVAFIDGSRTNFSRDTNLRADWSDHHNERTIVSTALEHRFNEAWQARLSYIQSNSDTAGKFGWAGVSETTLEGANDILLTNYRSKFRADVFDARLNGGFTLWDRQHDVVIGYNASDLNNRVPYNAFTYDSPVQILNDARELIWDGSYPEPDWSMLPNYPEEATTKQSGAYIATHLRATDHLSLLAGIRLSNWETRRHDLSSGDMIDDRKESGVLTPYLGVGYDLTDWLTAYASYTTIFNPQNFRDVSGRTLDPEEGESRELGLKGEWFDSRLNASASVFWSGKDNLAVADGDNLTPQGEQAYVAADDAKAHGFDVEVSGQLIPGWQIQASYTRTLLEDSSGTRLSTEVQPEHQVKLFTTWTPPSLSRLTVGGGVLWQSKIYGTLSVDPELNGEFVDKIYTQDSYAVINLNANYAFNDHLTLAVQLNNAFDETYRVHAVNHYYGAPRNLYTTLKYQF